MGRRGLLRGKNSSKWKPRPTTETLSSLMKSDEEIVNFAAVYAYDHTYSIWSTTGGYFRSGNDMLGFFILGFSGCGELAFIEKSLLDQTNIQSRVVNLPGENHEFLEVNINGTWMVSDPGYPNLWYNTTQERGLARINENNIGGLAFAYNVENGTIIWRTEYYVSVDTIILRICNYSIPIANESIMLNHEFQGANEAVNGLFSLLDTNGTVTFKMGNLQNYSDPNTERCFWVSVNGVPTGFNITSFGLNQTRFYNIDIGLKTSDLIILDSNNLFTIG